MGLFPLLASVAAQSDYYTVPGTGYAHPLPRVHPHGPLHTRSRNVSGMRAPRALPPSHRPLPPCLRYCRVTLPDEQDPAVHNVSHTPWGTAVGGSAEDCKAKCTALGDECLVRARIRTDTPCSATAPPAPPPPRARAVRTAARGMCACADIAPRAQAVTYNAKSRRGEQCEYMCRDVSKACPHGCGSVGDPARPDVEPPTDCRPGLHRKPALLQLGRRAG